MADKQVVTSKKFSLKLTDWVRGLIVAVVTGPITVIIESLNAGTLTFNWKSIATVGLSAGLSYILKNWLMTPTEITIQNPTKAEWDAVKEGDATAKVVEK